MKVAAQQGKGRMIIGERPTPKAGAGQVLIKISYCGICSSDLHYFNHDHAPSGHVLGHEWPGTAVEIGEGVDKFKSGHLVTVGDVPLSLVPEQISYSLLMLWPGNHWTSDLLLHMSRDSRIFKRPWMPCLSLLTR